MLRIASLVIGTLLLVGCLISWALKVPISRLNLVLGVVLVVIPIVLTVTDAV